MSTPSLYKNANSNTLILLLLLSLCTIGTGLYLTNHYFESVYPEGLQGSSLCDVNSFFNCDSTTFSPISNIRGVPISLLGLLIGVLSLAGFLFNSAKYEGTLYGVLLANGVGCLLLFAYSLVGLKTLCPFCLLYYVFSILLFFVLHKKRVSATVDPKILSLMGLFLLIVVGPTYAYVQTKEGDRDKMRTTLIQQYHDLPDLGTPPRVSPYKISFPLDGESEEAPLRIIKFSDFECPACKALSGHLGKISHKYKGKVDIQYFFYPLDPSCNPGMETQLHQNACYASYLAYCLPQKFREIEHLIFDNQENLSLEWLKGVAERENVLECFESADTQAAVTELIQLASPFNVSSTPTILINGKKIEGVLPLAQLYIILDEILGE